MVERIIEKLSVRMSQGTARWFISLALLFGIVVPVIEIFVGLDGWAGVIIAFIAALVVTAWATLCITIVPEPPGHDPNLHYYIVTKPGELSLSMIGRDADEVRGIADAIEAHLKSQGHEISRELP